MSNSRPLFRNSLVALACVAAWTAARVHAAPPRSDATNSPPVEHSTVATHATLELRSLVLMHDGQKADAPELVGLEHTLELDERSSFTDRAPGGESISLRDVSAAKRTVRERTLRSGSESVNTFSGTSALEGRELAFEPTSAGRLAVRVTPPFESMDRAPRAHACDVSRALIGSQTLEPGSIWTVDVEQIAQLLNPLGDLAPHDPHAGPSWRDPFATLRSPTSSTLQARVTSRDPNGDFARVEITGEMVASSREIVPNGSELVTEFRVTLTGTLSVALLTRAAIAIDLRGPLVCTVTCSGTARNGATSVQTGSVARLEGALQLTSSMRTR
jgi:hypothetical protein